MAGKVGRRSGRRTAPHNDVVVYREMFFSDGDTEIRIDTEEEMLSAIQRLLDPPVVGPSPPDRREAPTPESGRPRRSSGSAFVKGS